MTTQQQQQGGVVNALVEEKHFRVRLERSAHLLKGAIEDALDYPLEELALGMWYARRPTSSFGYEEITVRALETDEGTSIEVRLENHTTPLALSAFVALMIVATFLVVPLFFLIAMLQSKQKDVARTRLVQMHKIWTELGAAVGAPKRSDYRSRPEPARARARVGAAELDRDEPGEAEEDVVHEDEQRQTDRSA